MIRFYFNRSCLSLFAILLGLFFNPAEAAADPARYPEFAQQQPAITPEFISLDQVVDAILNGKKPLIVDVRSSEEYEEGHIKAAISIPLGEVPLRLAEIPRDRLVVLY